MKVAPKPILKDNDNATSPVFGALLMILLTFILAVATVAAVYNDDAVERISNSLTKTPAAVIKIEGIVGGIQSEPTTIRFIQNYITLMHKSGDSLVLDSTMILLSGEGSSYIGSVGHGGKIKYGDTTVRYTNLATNGKHSKYNTSNPAIDDNIWSAGEHLTLWGEDSINGTDASSVSVSVNGISNTSNNYGFKSGTTVTIKIFDKTTQRIIAEGTAIVKPAE